MKPLNLPFHEKFYKDSIDFSNAPKRLNNKYPLSDQKNEGGWVLNKKASDEFKGKKLNEERWFPTNPKWKGRQPTFFAKENTTFENWLLCDENLQTGSRHTARRIYSHCRFPGK